MMGSDVATRIKDDELVLLNGGFMDMFNLTCYPNVAPLAENQDFDSLHINIQPKKVKAIVKLYPEHLSKPPLGMAALTAWRSGAEFFRGMLLFFLRIWPAFVIGTLVWYGYRKLAVRK